MKSKPKQNPLASIAGKALAQLRKPANMRRGGAEFYAALARKSWRNRNRKKSKS